MSRTTIPLTFGDWNHSMWQSIKEGIGVILTIPGIIMLAAFITGDWQSDSDEHRHDRQASVVKMFNEIKGTPSQQATARQELARGLLNVRNHGVPVDELDDSVALKQVQQIAKTGEPPSIVPFERSFWSRAGGHIMGGIYICLAFASFAFGMTHTDAMKYRGRYMSDLPWRKPWPWLVMLPAAWLTPWLVVDYLRRYRERKRILSTKLDPRAETITRD